MHHRSAVSWLHSFGFRGEAINVDDVHIEVIIMVPEIRTGRKCENKDGLLQ